ncbi:MAG TPA: hypothetical protein VGG38_12780 [Acidimicrobiales bacterium]|jgi:hypothetical protein
MVSDEAVEHALALIDRSGVAVWIEDQLCLRQRGPGRPRALKVSDLLCALMLLARDDRPLHLSAATELLFCRLSEAARATLGIQGRADDHRSLLARYRQVRYLFSAVSSVLDPSGLVKNRRINDDEFAERCTSISSEEAGLARARLEKFMGDVLRASVDEYCGGVPPGALAYGLDATPVPLFSRGPSRRAGLCASDPDGGWYVRDGDHREREDHQGRPRSRVAWALEATVATTASGVPGTIGSFPNLVVGLALGRPGTDPGGTAVRVLAGVVSRGFLPGPLGVDRAYSGALSSGFHLPVRAMGFAPVVDYRNRPAGPSGEQPRCRHGRGHLVLPVDA